MTTNFHKSQPLFKNQSGLRPFYFLKQGMCGKGNSVPKNGPITLFGEQYMAHIGSREHLIGQPEG